MRIFLLGFVMTATFTSFFMAGFLLSGNATSIPVLGLKATPVPTPLSKYSIENLANSNLDSGKIKLGEVLENNDKFVSYKFQHKFTPDLVGSVSKTVTGVLNVPEKTGKFPLILMLRGYVDKEIYYSGLGTSSAARVFSNNGYITLAPDFLGYADSDTESSDILEARFQTYTTGMSLINSLGSLEKWDKENIFIWGHSNGGHIGLALLTITGKHIPTTLWAPVTKPFPYSILFYTDQLEDNGKYIRKELSKFENTYDIEEFSFVGFLGNIKAPIQIHQGGADDAVPVEWSNDFVDLLKDNSIEVGFFKYSAADHNMKPVWETAIVRDLEFFKKQLTN